MTSTFAAPALTRLSRAFVAPDPRLHAKPSLRRANVAPRPLSRRGQNALEFILLLAFLLMIFLGFFFVIQGKIREQNVLNSQDQFVQLADLIEKEVLLASKSNFGYMRAFTLPTELNNEPYVVSIEDATALAPNGDTLVIKTSISGTEYVRFLSVRLNFADTGVASGFPQLPTGDPVILEKTEYMLIVRNDCTSLAACS